MLVFIIQWQFYRLKEGLYIKLNSFSKFLREYQKLKRLRLFMPGHQGKAGFLNDNISPKFDLTEIKSCDNLYNPRGIIKSLEEKISTLYESDGYLSTGGSSLLIQTILWLFKDREFIVARNAHVSFYHTAAILGISVSFIGNHKEVKIKEIDAALLKVKKGAVLFITSPNYYGELLDITKIKKICEKFSAILVVDAAHGAHLRFTKKNLHPIKLGADCCCCSFHKTLPALTGASVLFFKENFFKREEVKNAMFLFASTSPSYLIMDSIGLCIDWLEKKGFENFLKLEENKSKLINELNLKFLKTDPSKLVLDCSNIRGGISYVLNVLEEFKIDPEFYDSRYVCFILTPFLTQADWKLITECFKKFTVLNLSTKTVYAENTFSFQKQCSLKDAIYAKKEEIALKDAKGEVCADEIFSEIPGVLLLAYGEIITKEIIEFLQKKGIEKIKVIKSLR